MDALSVCLPFHCLIDTAFADTLSPLFLIIIVQAIAMPKRPGTSWNMFFREHMEAVKASGKPVVPTVEGAIAAEKWKNLGAAEKQVNDTTPHLSATYTSNE